ncbi:MAG: glycosyltransferase [Bacteroidota bacterium]
MKQKIVLIGPTYPYRGGNSLFMSYLYVSLKDHFEVTFINYSVLYPSLLFPGTTQYDKSEEHFEKVPSLRLINSMNPISWYKTAQHINGLNPDLVVFDWWQPYFGPCHRGISMLLKKELKPKILFITENVISHEARWIDQILTQIGLKHAAKFLALSKQVEVQVRPFAGDRRVFRSELPIFGHYSKTENLDTDQVKKDLGFETNDTILMFFGYVRKYKGLDILIDAFAELVPNHPQFKLLIAGEFYDNPQPYLKQIEQLGIQDKVKVVNQFIPNEQVAQFFTTAEVVVLPYRSATQSGILNIAYGYDKPVVITKVGGLHEFVEDGHTGVFVLEAEKSAVAKGILRYFELAKTIPFGENIRRKTAQNSFGKIVDVFKDILADVQTSP